MMIITTIKTYRRKEKNSQLLLHSLLITEWVELVASGLAVFPVLTLIRRGLDENNSDLSHQHPLGNIVFRFK